MILADMTWPEVAELDRSIVVLIPTGSLEQHGTHLPLFTDSVIATAVAREVEKMEPKSVLLTPTLWLGASGHHLAFAGSLSASFDAYTGLIQSIVESLQTHGFHKFFIVNGHGGNSEPNGLALRTLKARYPECTFGHGNYYAYAVEATAAAMTGPFKDIRHACEGETSLVMHLAPQLVRSDRLRDDGLAPDPAIRGLVHHFDEMSEQGSIGYATLGSAEIGKAIFDAAVEEIAKDMVLLARGYALKGFPEPRGD